MADVLDGGSHANAGAGYVDITDIISAAGQTAVNAEVDKLLALIPDNDTAQAPDNTDWIEIPPGAAARLRNEITLLKTAIDAAPTS